MIDFSDLNVSLCPVTIEVKSPFLKFANGIMADLILAVLDNCNSNVTGVAFTSY